MFFRRLHPADVGLGRVHAGNPPGDVENSGLAGEIPAVGIVEKFFLLNMILFIFDCFVCVGDFGDIAAERDSPLFFGVGVDGAVDCGFKNGMD